MSDCIFSLCRHRRAAFRQPARLRTRQRGGSTMAKGTGRDGRNDRNGDDASTFAGPARDTASMNVRHVVFGGGAFDNSGDHPNKKGWDIFELGQKSFWAVPTAIPWDEPIREDPEYGDHIAAMLG